MTPVPGANRIEQFAQAVAERAVLLVMDSIDMDALLGRVDVDAIVQRVDVDRIVGRVDVDAIIQRVDVDGIIQRVDVDKILERVDIAKLMERVDVKAIIDQVDIDDLMAQTELGTIIARSTSGVASEVLDAVRAQGVGLDDFVARWVNRILRRKAADLPVGPPSLVAAAGPVSDGGDR